MAENNEAGAVGVAAAAPAAVTLVAGRPLVELDGIFVEYGHHRVLQPTSLAIREGEFLTILGPSGSGKTTILKILGGFLKPNGGRVLFNGRDLTEAPPERRPFNTVFQDYALFPHMSVAENVAYSLRVRGVPKPARLERAAAALEMVGLKDMGGRKTTQLSGGQQQRVALARAIVAEPAVILLDEPLSALDAALRHQMQIFLKEIQQKLKTTFVFVTHDQQEALTMSDRMVVVNQGRIAQIGTCTEIYDRPANAFVATFIGRNNLMQGTALPDGRVQTAAGIVRGNAPAPADGRVLTLAVRPERIRLHEAARGPAAGENQLLAEVEMTVFGGAQYSYRLHSVAAPTIRLEVTANSGDRAFAAGDRVVATFDADDVRLIACESA